MSRLVVLLNGREVGTVEQRGNGDLVMTYEDLWRDGRDSYPLSLSMPLTTREHADTVVRAFLEGLLPDNRDVLERWARDFHVSPRNPFALLTHVGEDCAGAVQFVVPERSEELVGAPRGGIEWVTEDSVADRLRDLVERHGTGRLAGDHGQFSLAGAQPKTALFHDGRRWGVPSGAWPTTHILKPPVREDLEGFDVNEHFCLTLAEELELAVVKSRVMAFGDQTAIVIERYDRMRNEDDSVVRLHQEDACQALAVPPWRKYENEGGPGIPEIVNLLMRESDDPSTDVGALLDAIALNWVIAGTDAHAKNYSILISSTSVRLAPLYDLLSALPYPRWVPPRKARLATRIDSEYVVDRITRRHWEGLAGRCDLDPGPVVQRVGELVEAVPAATERAAGRLRSEGSTHAIIDRLEKAIAEHGVGCAKALR